MEIKISEERRAQLLNKDREEKERRRKTLEGGIQQEMDQGQYDFQKQLNGSRINNQVDGQSLNQSDLAGKMMIANILNNKYQGDRRQNEELFEIDPNEYGDYENYEDIVQKENDSNSHRHYSQNINNEQIAQLQMGDNNAVKYGVEQLIQEKMNANQGNLFSLDQIKQRFIDMQKRNVDMKQQFQQNIENIQMKDDQDQNNTIPINQRESFQQQNQHSFNKYMNPNGLPPHPNQSRLEKNYNQMPLLRDERDESFNNRDQQSKSAKKITQNPFLQGNNDSQLQYPTAQVFQRETTEMADDQRLQSEQSLYEKKRSSSYTQRRTEQEYIQQNKFSFKPEINEIPKQIYGDCEKLKISRQEQWERLLRDKIETLASRDNQKILQQQKEITEKCTFIPQISEISKQIVGDKQGEAPIQERLYTDGLKKQQEREELKRKYEDQKQYPFKPNIQESILALKGNAAFTKPLHERLDDVLKERQENRLQLQMKNQNDQQYTFKPEINSKSEIIAKEKLEGKSVVRRLLDDIQEKEQRKSKIIENHNQSPSINPSNRDEGTDQDDLKVYPQKRQEEFVQRQYLMADFLKEKLEQKIKDIYKSSEYTFKPQVNQVSKYLVQADDERATETNDDKIKRLHEQVNIRISLILKIQDSIIKLKDQMKKQIVQEQIQKAYYDQFQFKPEINSLSKKIARKTSLDSLAFDKDKNQKRKKIKEKVEKEKMKECSFQPQINKNKKFDNLKSHYSKDQITQSLKEEKLSKEKQMQQLRKQIEYEEMKECTFNPVTKVLETVDYKEKVQNMRGVDRFLQQKELSKKQSEQTKKREEEVFNVKNMSSYRESNKTVIQPFKLSKGNGPTIKKTRDEILQECTFQPRTNESQTNQSWFIKNKEIIQKIISSNNTNNTNPNQFEQVPEIEEINYELQKNLYKNLQNQGYTNYENNENINNNLQKNNYGQTFQEKPNLYEIQNERD